MSNTAKTGIVITAEDRSKGAFDSAQHNIASLNGVINNLTSSFGGLSALISGLGVTSFAALVERGIESAAALDDMAEKAGSSVETLSGLVRVAQIGGHEIGLVEQAMIKLAEGLADADNKSSGAARALQALGLSAADLRGMDTGDAIKVVADRLNQFSDGAGKTALSIDLLGRSGAQALPFLKDLAEQGDLVKTVTAAQAAEADKLQKEIGRLTTSLSEMGRALSLEVAPRLNETIENFKRGREAGIGFWQALTGIGVRGLNESVADAKIGAFQHIVDLNKELSKLEKDRAYHVGRGDSPMTREVDADIAGVKTKIEYFKKLQAAEALASNAASYSHEGRTLGLGRRSLSGYISTGDKPAKPGKDRDAKQARSDQYAGMAGFDDNRSAKEIMAELHAEDQAMEALAKARRAMGDSVQRLGETYARDLERVGDRDLPAAQRELADSLRSVDDRAAAARKEISRYADAQSDQVAAQASASISIAELNAKTTEQKDAVRALWEEQQRLNGSWEYGATKALDKYLEQAADVAGQTEQLFSRAFKGMEDALVDFAMTGKLDFKSLADSIIADIVRIQVRAAMSSAADSSSSWLKPLLNAAVSYFGGSSSGGAGSMSSGGSVQGNSDYVYDLHSGGVVGSGEGSGIHARPMSLFSGARRYHGGGLVDGEVPIIAKRGEGVFTPEQMKAMGGDAITINVAVDASGEKASGGPGNTNELGRKIGSAVRAVIVEEKRPGGLLAA